MKFIQQIDSNPKGATPCNFIAWSHFNELSFNRKKLSTIKFSYAPNFFFLSTTFIALLTKIGQFQIILNENHLIYAEIGFGSSQFHFS